MDKIVCVGKNYVEHARELGDAVPERPVLFLKPPSVLLAADAVGAELRAPLPQGAGSVHHECEIVLRLHRGGARMDPQEAEQAIEAVALGLDMTLRDRQAEQKKKGHPWTTSKVFLGSAVVGPFRAVADFPAWLTEPFTFTLDGLLRQQGRATDMSLSPAQCVAYISEFFPLCPGDLIYTGTPAGVGPVCAGQKALLAWAGASYAVRWEAAA